jgi:hypothetical protein
MEFTVKVPVKVTAGSEEEALALAEKQFGARPKKAVLVEASLWPDALRPLAETHGIEVRHNRVRWGTLDGGTWVTNGIFGVRTPGVTYDGEPDPVIQNMPRGEGNQAAPRTDYRLHSQIGDVMVDARFLRFVEAIHGPCEWRVGVRESEATAYVGAEWVAVVMPTRENLTANDARKRKAAADAEVKRCADVLAQATSITAAAAAIPEAEKLEETTKAAWAAASSRLSSLRRSAANAPLLAGAAAKLEAATKAAQEATDELKAMGVMS